MDSHRREDEGGKKRPRKPLFNKKKLDRFLSSICEAAGMTGGRPAPEPSGGDRLSCRAPCGEAEWRAHLDVADGLLCVCTRWSKGDKKERHRDVTIGVTYRDRGGEVNYSDMTFCDNEVRWLMETLWHAPIWD